MMWSRRQHLSYRLWGHAGAFYYVESQLLVAKGSKNKGIKTFVPLNVIVSRLFRGKQLSFPHLVSVNFAKAVVLV